MSQDRSVFNQIKGVLLELVWGIKGMRLDVLLGISNMCRYRLYFDHQTYRVSGIWKHKDVNQAIGLVIQP